MTWEERSKRIVRVMEELYSIHLNHYPGYPDPFGCFLGECDWLEELHYLIWNEKEELLK